jgi:hypothetical protein
MLLELGTWNLEPGTVLSVLMGATDTSLRIPKTQVTVDLALEGRTPRRAELFVPLGPASRPRYRRVQDLLEASAPFLPARLQGGRSWLIVSRDRLVFVGVPLEVNEDLADSEFFEQHSHVHLEMVDGSCLAGELLYSSPRAHARVVDYLGDPARYLPLFQGHRVLLVSKHHLVSLTEDPD